jgi:hypothetical protein
MEIGELVNPGMLDEHNQARELVRQNEVAARRAFDELRACLPGTRTPFLEFIEFLFWLGPINACAELENIGMATATLYYSVIEGRALGPNGNEVAQAIVMRSKKLNLSYAKPSRRMDPSRRTAAL